MLLDNQTNISHIITDSIALNNERHEDTGVGVEGNIGNDRETENNTKQIFIIEDEYG